MFEKSIKIVSTYFLHGAFKVFTFRVVFFSFFVSKPDIFGLPSVLLLFVVCLLDKNLLPNK